MADGKYSEKRKIVSKKEHKILITYPKEESPEAKQIVSDIKHMMELLVLEQFHDRNKGGTKHV